MGFFPNSPIPAGPISGVTITGAATPGAAIVATSATAGVWSAVPIFQRQATSTPAAGTALINGTQTLATWTAPNDGLNHRVSVRLTLDVTVAATGGAIGMSYTAPDGTVTSSQTFITGSQGLGTHVLPFNDIVIAPNTAFSVQQVSALTAGTASCVAEIWGS